MNLARVLAQAFDGLPAGIGRIRRGPEGSTHLAKVRVGNYRYEFQLEIAGEGWPSDVHELLLKDPKRWPRRKIVVARRFSPGALRLLRSRDANWIDTAGNVRIRVPPGLLIDKASPSGENGSPSGFKWGPSSIDIAEWLLSHRETEVKVSEVAKRTGWSPAQTTSVLKAFDKTGWTKRHGAARGPLVWRELVNRGSLLEAWAVRVSQNKLRSRFAHALMRDPMSYLRERIAPVLSERGKWAATAWAAASILAPYTTLIPVLQLYVPDDLLAVHKFDALLGVTGLRGVDEGGNVEFRAATPHLLKHIQHNRLPLASPPRIYADLIAMGGRAEDVAQHFRETVLGY